jgi:hypothetical protein
MDNQHHSDRDRSERATSLKVAAAVVTIGLAVAAVEGSLDRVRQAPAVRSTLAAFGVSAERFPTRFDARAGIAAPRVEAVRASQTGSQP